MTKKEYTCALHDTIVSIDADNRIIVFTPVWRSRFSSHHGINLIDTHAQITMDFGIGAIEGVNNARINWGHYETIDHKDSFRSNRYFNVIVEKYNMATKSKHQTITLRLIGYGFDMEASGLNHLPATDLDEDCILSMDFNTFIQQFMKDYMRQLNGGDINIRGLQLDYNTNEVAE